MKAPKFRWVFALVLAAAPWVAAESSTPPPDLSAPTSRPGIALRHDPAPTFRLGSMTAALEKTPLDTIRTAVGAGRLDQSGDASTSLTWLCYTAPEIGQRIWLAADEMGGGNVDEITVASLPAGAAATAECPALPQRFQPLRLANGLGIGSTEAEVRRVMGAGGKRAGWSYRYDRRKGGFDIQGYVFFKMKHGQVVALVQSHLAAS
jgi:hypothetical protein